MKLYGKRKNSLARFDACIFCGLFSIDVNIFLQGTDAAIILTIPRLWSRIHFISIYETRYMLIPLALLVTNFKIWVNVPFLVNFLLLEQNIAKKVPSNSVSNSNCKNLFQPKNMKWPIQKNGTPANLKLRANYYIQVGNNNIWHLFDRKNNLRPKMMWPDAYGNHSYRKAVKQ